jgi:hypothetical protein
MKKTFSRLMFTFCMLLTMVQMQAQDNSDYKTAIGLRFGYPSTLSVKQFFGEKVAVEAFVGYRGYVYYHWINAGGMIQMHKSIPAVDGLKWYWGGGASAYFWTYDNSYFYNKTYSNTSIGILGCVGLDYKVKAFPVNISLDWAPTFFLNGYGDRFGYDYGAVSLRYVIK